MSNDSTLFNFVSDKQFRGMLEHDYREILKCIAADCPKSATVMSGSVIECLALFALSDLSLWPSNKGDMLKADLSSLISQLYESKILSEKTRDLSSVIRYYRNLIHPGRTLRLQEGVDGETAKIAVSLVKIIAREVGNAFVNKHGLTAIQFVEKLKIDPSASNLAGHYLKRMTSQEIRKLVVDIIPEKLADLEDDLSDIERNAHASRIVKSLVQAFRMARGHESMDNSFARSYVEVLRNGSEETIRRYDKYLVGGNLISCLSDDDKAMVIDHWKNRVKQREISNYYSTLEDILDNIEPSILADFVSSIRFTYNLWDKSKWHRENDAYRFLLDVVPGRGREGTLFLEAVESMAGGSLLIKMCENLVDNSTKIPF